MEASLLSPFSSTLTEALILHIADRSVVDIAKYMDRKALSGRLMTGRVSLQRKRICKGQGEHISQFYITL